MKRILAALLGLLALAGLNSIAAQPNFLLILTDDQGYGDVSAYHAADVSTPNIDRIGAQGMPFTTLRDLYFVRREGGLAYAGKSYEAIIRGDWKLMENDPFSPLELYHIKTDPQERINLAATNRKMVNKLSAALRQQIQRGGATPWQKPPAATRKEAND